MARDGRIDSRLMAAGVAVGLLVGATGVRVAAQSAPSNAPTRATTSAPAPASAFLERQAAGEILARVHLIGRPLNAEAGGVIGDIEDVVLDGDRVAAVIVGIGGFLGVGERKIAIRYTALRFESGDSAMRIVLPGATKESLGFVQPYAFQPAGKSILQKAGEVAKDAARKAGDAAKAGIEKAKEAVQGIAPPVEEHAAPPAAGSRAGEDTSGASIKAGPR